MAGPERTSERVAARPIGELRRRRDGTIRGLLTDTLAIERVLVDKARSFRKPPGVAMLRPALGNGIFTSEGEPWLRHRRLMQPAFSRTSIERYGDVMVRRASAAADRWAGLGRFDALTETRRLTLGIAVETLFGAEITEREARDIGAGVRVGSMVVERRWAGRLHMLISYLPTPRLLGTMLGLRRLNRMVDRIIGERRRRGGRREDLLGLLEQAKDPDTGGMSERELRDEVNTLLLAGHETTALALAWTLYLLAQHPAVDAELVGEVASLGRGRLPTAADLPSLPVSASIVKETLRMYPPIPAIGRQAITDVDIEGHAIPAGSRLRLSLIRQHHDAGAFEAPAEFRPERWRGGLDKRLDRASYLPFGMGPRMCIGSSFATMELALALATIRQRGRLELLSGTGVQPVPMIGLQPDRPIILRLVPDSEPAGQPAASSSGLSASAAELMQ